MVSNSSPRYFLELIKWEREGDVRTVVESHITSEFLEATCPVLSPAGCADCGYDGDLFSPTHLRQCVPLIGVTTSPTGLESTERDWWSHQDSNTDYAWDDKREIDTFTADILSDYDR